MVLNWQVDEVSDDDNGSHEIPNIDDDDQFFFAKLIIQLAVRFGTAGYNV